MSRPILPLVAKPRIFIGSSKEQLSLARAVQDNLSNDFETKIWDEDVFKLSEYTLESLSGELDRVDFGIFIFAPDDLSIIRGRKHPVARDNIIFESGMFVGKLGRQCTFIISPQGGQIHLPTDLVGLTVGEYDPPRSDGSMTAALAPCCNKIRKLVQERWSGIRNNRSGLIHSALFTDFDERFRQLISTTKEIEVCFVHSRRWRENNHDRLNQFLAKEGTTLNVILPDLENVELIRSIMGHFDDGPFLPTFIASVYSYFLALAEKYPGKIKVSLYQMYPTYSFYRFDTIWIAAFYPTTNLRRNVPTFEIHQDSPLGEFLTQDLTRLQSCSRELAANSMPALLTKAQGYSAINPNGT